MPLPCWGSYEILLRLVHTAARRSGGTKVAFVIGASKQHLHSSPNPSAVFDPANAVCSVGHQRGVGDEVDRVITYTYTSVSFFPQFFSARFDRWKKKVRTVAGKACTLPCFLHCHSLLHARRDKFLARTPFWRRRSWGVVLASCFCIGWHDHVRGLILRTVVLVKHGEGNGTVSGRTDALWLLYLLARPFAKGIYGQRINDFELHGDYDRRPGKLIR